MAVSKAKTLEQLRDGPLIWIKSAMGQHATSYSKVIKIEGDYIRRTPFEAEDVDDVDSFDVKKYKIVGDLGNPRISFYGYYEEADDEDFDDDDYDDDEPTPRTTTSSSQPAGDYYTPEQLDAIVNAAVARALKSTAPKVAVPVAPVPTPTKSWRSSINA